MSCIEHACARPVVTVVLVMLSLLPLQRLALAQAPEPRRVAILIGANEASPGRRPLRYGHRDARAVGRVLQRVGGFDTENVHVLLDPAPATVLSLLDGELGRLRNHPGESILVFYYSGHADEQALYPNGAALQFRDIRTRLESDAAEVRLGIIDACRGGGWTGTRGLTESEPFEVNIPMELSNKGSALIAASSGLEDAHESESLRGGFFTHHWNAALLGAADRDGNREVTLREAFEYANRLTIRDTALHADTPQHPSFRINLSGRRSLSLSRLSDGNSTLRLHQKTGPLQLIHLETGDVVLELPEGARDAELAIAPGPYLVRTAPPQRMRAAEVHVRHERPTTLREEDLAPVDEVYFAARGVGGTTPTVNLSTLPAGTIQLQGALGVARDDSVAFLSGGTEISSKAPVGRLTLAIGLTDHLQLVLPLPALAFRHSIDSVDLVPWAGFHDSRIPTLRSGRAAPGFGFYGEQSYDCTGTFLMTPSDCTQRSAFSEFAYAAALGAGLDGRWRMQRNHSFLFGTSLRTPMALLLGQSSQLATAFSNWTIAVMFGGSYTIDDSVTLTLVAQYEQNIDPGSRPHPTLRLGALQAFGLRPVPLVRVQFERAALIGCLRGLELRFR